MCCVQKGFSALHIAAKYGNAEMIRLLLERNVDVNSPGKHHLTSLHVSAHYKHANVAALLLDNHADPHRIAKVNIAGPCHKMPCGRISMLIQKW